MVRWSLAVWGEHLKSFSLCQEKRGGSAVASGDKWDRQLCINLLAERTGGHGKEQISVVMFWVVRGFLLLLFGSLTRISEFGRLLKISDALVPSHF